MHKCSQELSSDWWATPWLGFAALARYTGYSHQAAPLDCVAIHWQDTVTRLPLAPSSRLRGTAPIKARCKCPPQKAFHGIRHFQMGLATISASARLDHGLLQQDVAELFQSQCSLPWSHLTKNLFRKCTDFEHSCGRKSKSNIAGFP